MRYAFAIRINEKMDSRDHLRRSSLANIVRPPILVLISVFLRARTLILNVSAWNQLAKTCMLRAPHSAARFQRYLEPIGPSVQSANKPWEFRAEEAGPATRARCLL